MQKYIATHSGYFHADDVYAVAAIKMLAEYAGLPVVRTRDARLIADATAVIDVGFVHDTDALRFDHHQSPRPVSPQRHPYSAFGLIWATFGERIVEALHPCFAPPPGVQNSECFAQAAEILQLGFVRAIDFFDNGIGAPSEADVNVLIRALNADSPSGVEQEARFALACAIADETLRALVRQALKEACDAIDVRQLIATARAEKRPLRVLELPRPLNWRRTVVAYNGQLTDPDDAIDLVLSPDAQGGYGLTCAPAAQYSFECRVLLPEALRGRSPEALQKKLKTRGVAFVHANGFYAAGTREALLRLADDAEPN